MTTPERELLLQPCSLHTRMTNISRSFAAICVTWLLTFTAYSGLQNLETSVSPSIGAYSLASLTGGGMITCLLAPAILCYTGIKRALIISWLCLGLFVLANFWPYPALLIGASVVEGLASGLMWTALGTFVSKASLSYAHYSQRPLHQVTNLFWTLFCLSFQSTQIWGNIISSAVLQSDAPDHPDLANVSMETPRNWSNNICGAMRCPRHTEDVDDSSAPEVGGTIYILLVVYLAMTMLGLAITLVFLKPMSSLIPTEMQQNKRMVFNEIKDTLKFLFTNSRMLMMIPFFMFTGLDQAIMYSEFTKVFVTCKLGISWVGYTMTSFGVTTTLGSPLCGLLGRYLPRLMLFYGATFLNICVLIIMRVWEPGDELVPYFIIPGLWGLADAVWQMQSGVLMGAAFPVEKQEQAFAGLHFFQACGFTVSYLYSNVLCMSTKLYIAASILGLGNVLLTVVETQIRHENEIS